MSQLPNPIMLDREAGMNTSSYRSPNSAMALPNAPSRFSPGLAGRISAMPPSMGAPAGRTGNEYNPVVANAHEDLNNYKMQFGHSWLAQNSGKSPVEFQAALEADPKYQELKGNHQNAIQMHIQGLTPQQFQASQSYAARPGIENGVISAQGNAINAGAGLTNATAERVRGMTPGMIEGQGLANQGVRNIVGTPNTGTPTTPAEALAAKPIQVQQAEAGIAQTKANTAQTEQMPKDYAKREADYQKQIKDHQQEIDRLNGIVKGYQTTKEPPAKKGGGELPAAPGTETPAAGQPAAGAAPTKAPATTSDPGWVKNPDGTFSHPSFPNVKYQNTPEGFRKVS